MSEPILPPAVASPRSFRDRIGGLVAFGILELLLALGCLLLTVATLATALVHPPAAMPAGYAPPPTSSLVTGALFYLGLALVLGWLGVGSILARRWACTLNLALGWIWLVVGAIGGAFELVLLPRMLAAVPGMEQPGARAFLTGCVVGVIVLFFVVLPLAFVLFYGGRNVRATCAARDPQPRWTDRCAVPVLALALISAVAVPCCALVSLHPAFPAFGYVLTGAPAAVVLLGFAALQAAVAWGLYRLRPAAWWALLALWLLGAGSTAVTFYRGLDWQKLLRASGQPDNPMVHQLLRGLFEGPFFLIGALVASAAFLGYLLWIKRYFVLGGADT